MPYEDDLGVEEVGYMSAKEAKESRKKPYVPSEIKEIDFGNVSPRNPPAREEFIEGAKEGSGLDKFKTSARGAGNAVGKFVRGVGSGATHEIGINQENVRPENVGRNIGGGAVKSVKAVGGALGSGVKSAFTFAGNQLEGELQARREARLEEIRHGYARPQGQPQRPQMRQAPPQNNRVGFNGPLIKEPMPTNQPNQNMFALGNPNFGIVNGSPVNTPNQPQSLPQHHNFGLSLFGPPPAPKIMKKKVMHRHKQKVKIVYRYKKRKR